MAYIDTNLEFSDAQAVTATAISSHVVDLFSVLAGGTTNAAGVIPNTRVDLGSGENDLWLVVSTQTAVTDVSSDATLAVTLESADDAALSTNAQVHFSTGTLAFAAYAAQGTSVALVKVPAGLYRRYLGVRFTVAAGPLTAGAFDAYLTTDPQFNRAYKSGYTVQ